MEVAASHKHAKISPRKARLVIDLIRGEAVDVALERMRLSRKRAASLIRKVIRAAVAAASDLHSVEADSLFVARAWVDNGPQRRWHRFRARGGWNRLLHRSSHIHVILSDERKGPEEGETPAEESES